MPIINFASITKSVEKLLKENLGGFRIERNARRNMDINIASQGSGWIGIYRGKKSFGLQSTGSSPWLDTYEIQIEIQVAAYKGEDAEDKLQDAEKKVLDILIGRQPTSPNSDLTLNGTVKFISGGEVIYDYNADEDIEWHSAIITIRAEARA